MIPLLAGVGTAAAGLPFWVVGAAAMARHFRGLEVGFPTKLAIFSLFTLKLVALGLGFRLACSFDLDAARLFGAGLTLVYFAFVGWAAARRAS